MNVQQFLELSFTLSFVHSHIQAFFYSPFLSLSFLHIFSAHTSIIRVTRLICLQFFSHLFSSLRFIASVILIFRMNLRVLKGFREYALYDTPYIDCNTFPINSHSIFFFSCPPVIDYTRFEVG